LDVFHLALLERALTCVTYTRPAAVVGAQTIGLGQVENALEGRVPVRFDSRFGKGNFEILTALRDLCEPLRRGDRRDLFGKILYKIEHF